MSLSCAVLGNKFALDRTRGNPYVGQHGVVAISLGAWRALTSKSMGATQEEGLW